MNGMKMMIGSLPLSSMMGGSRSDAGTFNPAPHAAPFRAVGEYIADAAFEDRGVLVSADGIVATVRAKKMTFQEAADARGAATGLYAIMFPVTNGAKDDTVVITTTSQDVLFNLLAVEDLPDELFVQFGLATNAAAVKAMTNDNNDHIRVLSNAGGIAPSNTSPSHLIVDKQRNLIIGHIVKEGDDQADFSIFAASRKSKSSQDYIINVSTDDSDIIKHIVQATVEEIALGDAV
ncbi:hypothetical protein MORTIMER_233 [Erwinia phage vB_EamM_Mortimer]|uniref:Uncharacterized protein n=1 Tax=Erwinia phage vB_EamM_Mortimer TaxID=2060129 RepID=A0A2H5BL20_9CAUD|nr:hypothetical protein MORTIMER_233 [Erwinia phage vB_EamM_Mortimer]